MTDFSLPNCCMPPVWKSGQPTVAPSGGTVVTGGQWGSWNGALIVAFLKDSQARVMVLNGAGGVASSSPFLGGFGRLRSVVQGPDGNLYVSTDNGAGDVIVKVTPS
jgi:glucose/arabinose dehydrogenase